ncbi:sapecin-B-like [Lucilia sericata]|uniref:sapecin-B-like n=1 Tax=Lucilia sericata TaxID=13632 RepID=UPI0018A7ECEB|nr:sapecin-B-like [Lucilia sericata]
MKVAGIFLICLAFLMLTGVKASEAQENLNQLDEVFPVIYDDRSGDGVQETKVLNRQKRLTCNIDRSFCLAHCLLRGYKRGFCTVKKICVCRH